MTNADDYYDALRETVKEQSLTPKGCVCPTCDHFVKRYERALPLATARVMIELYHAGGNRNYVYLPPILDTMEGTAHQGGYGTLAWHWGLIKKQVGVRKDGSKSTGYWKLTSEGVEFVLNEATVPEFAVIEKNELVELTGRQITIQDALGNTFDYSELMER